MLLYMLYTLIPPSTVVDLDSFCVMLIDRVLCANISQLGDSFCT